MKGAIVAMGARTAVGLDAHQTAFGLRSRRFAPGHSPFEDRRGHRLGLGRLRALPDDIDGFDRLVALGAPALAEAARGAAGPVALFLAAPEPHPGFLAREGEALAHALAEMATIDLDPASLVITGGAGAFALVVQRALEHLRASPEATIVVGGVDSYYDRERLEELDAELRILAPEAPAGFLPGEGAGFLRLGAAEASDASGRALVEAWAGADAPRAADEPALAEALTALVEAAERGLSAAPWLLVDDVMERARHREWSFVLTRRTTWAPDGEAVRTHLAEHAGSLGAAAGPVAAIWAAVGHATGFSPAPVALVVLASDGPARGVVAVHRPDGVRSAPGPARRPRT